MTAGGAAAEARALVADPEPVAHRWRAGGGGPVVGTIGACVPHELVAAAGALPVRLPVTRAAGDGPGRRFPGTGLDARTAGYLAGLLDGRYRWLDALVIGRDTEAHAKLFAVLRELRRTGALPGDLPVAFVDVAWLRRPASARYNRVQVDRLADQVTAWSGQSVTDAGLHAAALLADAGRRRLRRLLALRAETPAVLSGVEAMNAVAASLVLPPGEHATLVDRLEAGVRARSPRPGLRLVMAGSTPADDRVTALVEVAGAVVVGEDHDRGARAVTDDRFLVAGEGPGDVRASLAARWHRGPPPAAFSTASARAAALVDTVRAAGAAAVLHLVLDDDPAAAWDRPAASAALAAAGIPVVTADDDGALSGRARWLAEVAGLAEVAERCDLSALARRSGRPGPPRVRPPAVSSPVRSPGRATTVAAAAAPAPLASTAAVTTYQREWFAGLRDRAAAGEPVAVVNADVPHEIFRAFDIPYVVTQWWSSLISAKQQAPVALAALAAAGYPDSSEQYNALPFGLALAGPGPAALWGGLPDPAVLCAMVSSDAMAKVFEAWAGHTGARLITFERTAETRTDIERSWWRHLPDDWDQVLQAERLDVMVADIERLVVQLEDLTGRRLDRDRLVEILDLVNEHEGWYGRTRDLVAATTPAPVTIADTIPATMIPQWHRGTGWGRDAARAFHDEVRARVGSGVAACPGERIRLMWLGRGLWSDLGIGAELEERYGAVFVWSMYLALAADGYVRRWRHDSVPRDPLRALAARYVPMGDEIRMPTWSAAWHAHEARTHRVDGVVSLGEDDWFSLAALERDGIPVLRLDQDNTDRRAVDPEALRADLARFIEDRVEPVAARRRETDRG